MMQEPEDPIRASFDAAVAKLPTELRKRVDPRTSSRAPGGQWELRDAAGDRVGHVDVPAVKPRRTAPVQRAHKPAIGPEFAAWMKQCSGALIDHNRRLAAIEAQLAGVQKRVDGERHSLTFCGAWQAALPYESGSLVTCGARAFVATKAIRSGGQPPGRHGGAWAPLMTEE